MKGYMTNKEKEARSDAKIKVWCDGVGAIREDMGRMISLKVCKKRQKSPGNLLCPDCINYIGEFNDNT